MVRKAIFGIKKVVLVVSTFMLLITLGANIILNMQMIKINNARMQGKGFEPNFLAQIENEMRRVIKADRQLVSAHRRLGEVLAFQGLYTEAAFEWSHGNIDIENQLLLSSAYLRNDQIQLGMQLLKSLSYLDPDSSFINCQIGTGYLIQGERKAIGEFQEMVEVDSWDSEGLQRTCFLQAGIAFIYYNKPREALKILKQLQPNSSLNYWDSYLVKNITIWQGPPLRKFQAASDVWFYYYLGLAHQEVREYSQALEAFQLTESLDPTSGWAYYQHGKILLEMDDPAAEDIFSQAMINEQSWFRRHQIAAGIGHAYKHQGFMEKARQWYMKAIEIYPQSAWGQFNMCVLLFEEKAYSNALPYCQRSVELDPENNLFQDWLTKTSNKMP